MDIDIDLSGLENKWVAEMTETPLCCVCDKPIGSDDHSEECLTATVFSVLCEEETPDCTCGAEDVPIFLFKEGDTGTLALAFHPECFGRRVKGCLTVQDLINLGRKSR